mmetsp:Transcript_31243/g.27607  ORF Transcript_31243/g.27607 Transcript_31243/m.27607 type:complete len:95 (+) Transcript_31243:592-876(+)
MKEFDLKTTIYWKEEFNMSKSIITTSLKMPKSMKSQSHFESKSNHFVIQKYIFYLKSLSEKVIPFVNKWNTKYIQKLQKKSFFARMEVNKLIIQ